jgi:serine/threonine protein kinase
LYTQAWLVRCQIIGSFFIIIFIIINLFFIQKNLDKIGNERLTKMSYHAVQGMCYLSDIGFVHRDLAARNILVGSDETCKIADFGLARELVENEYGVNKGGRIPVRWTAPEAISHRSFTTASDVWSFGVLLWEMFSYGATPYDGWDNFSIFQRLENGERLVQPMGCPDDLYQLMLSCWAAERSERPTFDQLKECLEIVLFGKPKPKPKPSHLTSPTRPSNEAPPSSPPPRNFTDSPGGGMSIKDLLNNIGMNRYTEHFHNNGYFTVLDCLELTEDDLNRMGIILSGHQYKIVKNIRMKEEELGRVSPSSPY